MRNRGVAILMEYAQPGKPQQNAHEESDLNALCLHEHLKMNQFGATDEGWHGSTQWPRTYSNELPSMALGGITPAMKFRAI